MKRALVAKPQLEVLCVGRIEQPEPDQTGRDSSNRRKGSVHDDGVASDAVGDIERAESLVFVFNRSIRVELSVLKDEGQIVHAERPRQPEPRIGSVIDNHHTCEAHLNLPGGVAVWVRMEPKRCGGLIDLQYRPPALAGLNKLLRPTVILARHE